MPAASKSKTVKKTAPKPPRRKMKPQPASTLDDLKLAEDSRIDKVRNENVGRLLIMSARIFERSMIKSISAMGFDDLRMSHLPMLRNIKGQGSRTTEIADQTNMTKQAVGSLIHELEELGYIKRFPDPTDGRAKLVRFSGRGLEFVSQLPEILHNSEQEIAALIGDKEFKVLRKVLQHLAAESTGA